jgi:outer membrane receptor protein involved in Fe transport
VNGKDGMTNRFTTKEPTRLPTGRNDLRTTSRWCMAGVGLTLMLFVAPFAGAEESKQLAQTGNLDSESTVSDPPAAPKPAAKKPPPNTGIEEIIVTSSESESTADFEAADSVTGFGAEDLAAIGAQDIADLAAFTPNLEIVTSGATTPTFFIRGVGLNDFNSNSTGAVAIYQDDVARNAPALQLSTLFDVEAVNVLRGPQGTGLARNASAGAIKIYARKPTGEYSAFLRSELGNFNLRDFEGALEFPIYEDIISSRFAFRFTERDGTMKNRCANAPPFAIRDETPRFGGPNGRRAQGKTTTDDPWSLCGELVPTGKISTVPMGLAPRVNDVGNWAARGTILLQPTLDMTWLLNAHGSRRDEYSRLGQSIGTRGFYCPEGFGSVCDSSSPYAIAGSLGGTQGTTAASAYKAPEIQARLVELAPCLAGISGKPLGTCTETPEGLEAQNNAKLIVAKELAEQLDSEPWAGDFNRTGRTTNDTWGVYANGTLVLPWGGMELTSVTGYDTYDRLIDIDLDFSPETLFQIITDDDGWQVYQDLRLQGSFGDESVLQWDIGSWLLREQLNVVVTNDLGVNSAFAVGERDYTQDLWSAAGYASLAFDFWDNFTLDGGFRYNWEQKSLDYQLTDSSICKPCIEQLKDTWNAPTGTVRLTYRFREDTHVFWKYTRGWKPGTYNATSSVQKDFRTGVLGPNIAVARPESIDAFETGVRGSWLEGRIGLDFSLFYYSYSDYQIFTAQQFASGQPEFVILNAEKAEVYGAEVDAVLRPWAGAFANVRFGWLESQFLDFVQVQQAEVSSPEGIVVVNRELQNTGNPLLNSPRFKVSLTGEQTLPLGRWGSLTARYDGVWTNTTYYDATEGHGIPNVDNVQYLPEDTIAQPAFWLHNVRLSYRPPGGRFEIAGWVRNLTNKAYKTFGFDGSTFNNTTIYFVGDPRTYGGTLTINF